jgi:hypothetical protein
MELKEGISGRRKKMKDIYMASNNGESRVVLFNEYL